MDAPLSVYQINRGVILHVSKRALLRAIPRHSRRISGRVIAKMAIYISFLDKKTGTRVAVFSIESSGPLAIHPTKENARCKKKGKILARLFHPVVTVETAAVWVFSRILDPGENLSPAWTSEPSTESNPPLPARRIARTRVAGEVSPDWRPWTIDQPETSPLF